MDGKNIPSHSSNSSYDISVDDGASLVEYALLVALIAVVCIAAVTMLGTAASSKFSSMGSALA